MVFVAPVKYYSCSAQCEGLSWILVIRTLGSSRDRSFSEYSCPVVRQHVAAPKHWLNVHTGGAI